MNQPQRDFINVNNPPPPPIDTRGDLRSQSGDERPDPATGLTPKQQAAVDTRGADPGMMRWYNENQDDAYGEGGADPLPVPPGRTDADLPDDTGPVSPTMRAASWRAGQAHVDAIGSGTYAEFVAKRGGRIGVDLALPGSERTVIESGADDRADALRYGLPDPPRLHAAAEAANNAIRKGMSDDLQRDMDRLRAQYPPAHPHSEVTRYVEGLAHTEPAQEATGGTQGDYRPPQGIPDASMPTMCDCGQEWTDEEEEADREAMSSAGVLALGFACAVLAVTVIVIAWGVIDWLYRVGKL